MNVSGTKEDLSISGFFFFANPDFQSMMSVKKKENRKSLTRNIHNTVELNQQCLTLKANGNIRYSVIFISHTEHSFEYK